MHMTGFALLSQVVAEKCGCATDANAACKTQCGQEAYCTDGMANMGLPTSGDACATCLQTEAAKGINSTCTSNSAFDPACQNDADCKAFVSCAINC